MSEIETGIPTSMPVVAISRPGGPEVLTLAERPVPRPGPGQVLIKAAAAGVNRPDLLQRAGAYPPPKGHSDLPGLETAGKIVGLGGDVTAWRIGDEVMALLNGGGYAAYAIAEAGSCLAVPAGLSLTEAAGVPETLFTVWHNVFERGGLKAGQWLLVHGGTSGIGMMAIGLGKALGARVIATCSGERKCEAARAQGAERAIDYSREDFVAAVAEATQGHGADVILDMVGGDYVDRNVRAAAEDGTIVNIAFLKGAKVTVDLSRAMMKRLTWTGSTLRPRTNATKAAFAAAIAASALPAIASKKVRIVVDRTFPLAEAAAAHAYLEAGQHVGKIVLTL